MNTTNQGKKPKKNKGQVLSLSDAVEMQKEQKAKESKGREINAGKEIYEAKINELLMKWYKETSFPTLLRKDWLCSALCNTSDIILQIPYDLFHDVAEKAVLSTDLVELSYSHMDIALQVMSRATAKDLDMNLGEYLIFKSDVYAIAQEFEKTFNENKERILAENPYKEREFVFPNDLDEIVDEQIANKAEDFAVNVVGEA